MLVTKCVSDNFEMLVTVLAVSVALAPALAPACRGIQKISSISKFCHQRSLVANIDETLSKGYIDVGDIF